MSMNKVAVTGSGGFIGQAVVKELEKRNMVAIPYDMSDGLNVQDEKQVSKHLKSCDGVIHLAGVLGTEELFDNPHKAVDINIKGALNVILACREYGTHYVGIQMPDIWQNIYQSTKRCAKDLAMAYHQHYHVPVAFVCAYNAWGKHQKVHGVQKIIPTFATKAWRGEALPIWGQGDQLVDLVYVKDVARMLVDALSFGNGETFDAGTGAGKTVLEVAEMVREIAESESALAFHPMRKGEHTGEAPVAKGRGWDLLGWTPTFDAEIFRDVVEWYKKDRV